MPQSTQQQPNHDCAWFLTDPSQWFSHPSASSLHSTIRKPFGSTDVSVSKFAVDLPKLSNSETVAATYCYCFLGEICQIKPDSTIECKDITRHPVTVDIEVSPSSHSQEAWQVVSTDLTPGRTLASIKAKYLACGSVSVRPELSVILPLPLSHVILLSDIIAYCSVRLCWLCRKRRRGSPLLRCANCRYARYCGPACQGHDWRRHELECGQTVRTVARLVCFNFSGPEPPFNPFYAVLSDQAPV